MKSRFNTHENQVESPAEENRIETPRSMHKIKSSFKFKQPCPKNLEDSLSLTARKKDKSKKTKADDQFDIESNGNKSWGPSNDDSAYEQQATTRYYSIAMLTSEQNQNLKQQNKFLVEKLKKLKQRQEKVYETYKKAKKYKAMYLESLEQIEMLREECQVYKEEAEQMKRIALGDFHKLEDCLIQNQSMDQSDQKLEYSQDQSHGENLPEY